jgi:hypothetical protein
MPSELPDSFNCGPFVTARNPDVGLFVDKLNRLREAVDACRIQPGVGYTLERSSGGTSLTIKTGSGSSAPEDLYPFKIKTRQKDKKYQFFVIQGSVANNATLVENQEEWIDFQAPARIYLEATFNDQKIASCLLKSIAPDEPLELVTISGGKQTQSRITIGLFIDPSKGKNFQIVQNVRTNLLASTICSDGYPAVFLRQEPTTT